MLNRKGTKERHWQWVWTGKILCSSREWGYLHLQKVSKCERANFPPWGWSARVEEMGSFSTLCSYKDNGPVLDCEETQLETEANLSK